MGKRAIGQYDLRAGADRLLRVLADYGVTRDVVLGRAVAEEAPVLVRRCIAEGHEVACHTWDHAHYDEMSADAQRADIERTRQALATITGTLPVGHKTAGFAPGVETPAILQSLGFLYQMDLAWGDYPEIVQPSAALPPLVHLPPTHFLDDYALYWDNLLAPDAAFALWQETVDVLRDEGGIACFTLHPHLMGRPAPSRVLARMLEYLIDLGDIWLARADHAASWWREQTTTSPTG